MSFPLFNRPGTVVFVDDDPDYLEMLALVLPRQWHAKLFLRPQDCIAHLQQESPFWEADAWNQQQLVDQWRAGRPLVPQILEYWARHTERYSLARVCVIDYSMPGMDGLQALAELDDWPGSRVLLTGQADDQLAIDAFNRGLIQQFVPKQMPDIARHLTDVVRRQMAAPHSRHAQTWRATLQPEHHALLREPSVARELAAIAAKRWVEHVVIGQPFGVLGLDSAGMASWLQLETPAGLPALAELGQVGGLPDAQVADIRAGRMLANIELAQSLRLPPEMGEALAIGSERQLLGAIYPIHATTLRDAGYTRWLARQAARHVER